tara:strand:+ start:22740 stop:22892 length:153 start_codon:yes stop_codon:yes gene_type:complete
MIEQILNMLKLTDHFDQSENIEIAKGKYMLYKNLKDLYKQEKRKQISKNL